MEKSSEVVLASGIAGQLLSQLPLELLRWGGTSQACPIHTCPLAARAPAASQPCSAAGHGWVPEWAGTGVRCGDIPQGGALSPACGGHCPGTLPRGWHPGASHRPRHPPATAPSAHAALHRCVSSRHSRFCSISTLSELTDARRTVFVLDGAGQSSLQNYHSSGFQS